MKVSSRSSKRLNSLLALVSVSAVMVTPDVAAAAAAPAAATVSPTSASCSAGTNEPTIATCRPAAVASSASAGTAFASAVGSTLIHHGGGLHQQQQQQQQQQRQRRQWRRRRQTHRHDHHQPLRMFLSPAPSCLGRPLRLGDSPLFLAGAPATTITTAAAVLVPPSVRMRPTMQAPLSGG
ncbi:unnamed protein product, partial [Pylaiella littoralis]